MDRIASPSVRPHTAWLTLALALALALGCLSLCAQNVTRHVVRSVAELRDMCVAGLRADRSEAQWDEISELLGGDNELMQRLPRNAVATLAFLYEQVQADANGSSAPAADDELGRAGRMAQLLRADPQLALPAEWEPLRPHFQSTGAALHVALHGSLEQLTAALAPEQSRISYSHDRETDWYETCKLVVAQVDPQTGALSFQTPSTRAW